MPSLLYDCSLPPLCYTFCFIEHENIQNNNILLSVQLVYSLEVMKAALIEIIYRFINRAEGVVTSGPSKLEFSLISLPGATKNCPLN